MELSFSAERIRKLLKRLSEKLAREGLQGELYLVGGAVLCLVHNLRPSTKDLDAVFVPKEKIRKLALEVARDEEVPERWLNDAVKGYLSPTGKFSPYLDLPNLKVFVADPEYLLAMKCLAMRLGPEFHDEEDVRFLLRYLNIESAAEAGKVLKKYYPLERFPQKTLYALEEILGK